MLHVNLPKSGRCDGQFTFTSSGPSLLSIDCERISWPCLNCNKHQSNVDMCCVRYSGDLEAIQENWGWQGFCFSLFPEGGRGICPIVDILGISWRNDKSWRSHGQNRSISPYRGIIARLSPEVVQFDYICAWENSVFLQTKKEFFYSSLVMIAPIICLSSLYVYRGIHVIMDKHVDEAFTHMHAT